MCVPSASGSIHVIRNVAAAAAHGVAARIADRVRTRFHREPGPATFNRVPEDASAAARLYSESMETDDQFVARFEATEIPLTEWTHLAHLRIAYTYLRRHGLDGAIERFRVGIPRFNASKGIPDQLDMGYHDTLTVAFLTIMASVMEHWGAGAGSAAFIEKHQELHAKTLLRIFYTRDRIMSWEAKRGFVAPDVSPLPPVSPGAPRDPNANAETDTQP